MENNKNLEVFSSMPVPKAVMKNALPAMAAMLMVLVYNLADTFFIGQTHNSLLVAAVSLATPVYLIFMSIGTLFGIGGTSVISRALGEGKKEKARKSCAFCFWGCVFVGILLVAFILIFIDPILNLIGASADTYEYAKSYLSIIVFAGPFVLISNCYGNVIRTEGESMLSIRLKDFTVKQGIAASVLAIGVPAALGDALMSVSHIISNSQMAHYGDMAVAGMGVAMKVITITGMFCMGLGQGVQPILGYCVGAKTWKRFKEVFKFTIIFALILGTVLAAICYVFTNQIVSAFLTDQTAFSYAVQFARILLSTSFLFGVFYVLVNALQAMGAATPALLISMSRQGIIFIPALFILQAVVGMTGLVWAQPVADVLSILIAAILFRKTMKKMQIM